MSYTVFDTKGAMFVLCFRLKLEPEILDRQNLQVLSRTTARSGVYRFANCADTCASDACSYRPPACVAS